jgi:hypothetical protein
MGKRKKRVWLTGALAGTALVAGYVAYENDFSVEKMTERARAALSAVLERETGDPLPEDLQRALGPAPPDGYVSVILAVEDVLLRRSYHRKFGWVYEPREGVKELLRSLVDPNVPVFVTLWSENGLAVASEVMDKLAQEIGGPPAHTQPVSVCRGVRWRWW